MYSCILSMYLSLYGGDGGGGGGAGAPTASVPQEAWISPTSLYSYVIHTIYLYMHLYMNLPPLLLNSCRVE